MNEADNYRITGSTKLIGFAGYPTEQGRSPQLLNERFRRLGMDCVVVPLKVAPEAFADLLRSLATVENFIGCIATIPHKREALQVSGAASEQARLTDLCNAIRWYPERDGFAEQFDGAGFVAGLREAGHTVAGRAVFLNGAGGAGRAVAFALAQAGARSLCVHDVNVRAAGELREQLDEFKGEGFATLASGPRPEDSLIVNASPVGMRSDDPFPIRVEALPQEAVLADVIMSPARTAWLEAGERRGHSIVSGLSMLHGQFEALETFFAQAYREACAA